MIMKATPNTRPRILFVTTADGLKSEDRLSIFHTNRDTTEYVVRGNSYSVSPSRV